MIKNLYGAQGYWIETKDINDLRVYAKGIIAALSQNKTFPADIDLAKELSNNIIDILED
jgi:hypothetical protein